MNLLCVKCGQGFSVSQDQLGMRGKCPHCRATVLIPRLRSHTESQTRGVTRPTFWAEHAFSLAVAIGAHAVLLVVIALTPWTPHEAGSLGTGEMEIEIGAVPQPLKLKNQMADLAIPTENLQFGKTALDEWAPPSTFSNDGVGQIRDMARQAAGGSGDISDRLGERMDPTDLSEIGGGQQAFSDLVSRLKKEGLDIAIIFDSTGSMGGEINQIKDQINEIGRILFQLVPETRISLCTYRDRTSDYLVKGLPLTNDLGEIVGFLSQISAGGGGDDPEAVQEGLRWVVENNQFRDSARKVILIFGDQPPHVRDETDCLKLAIDFRRQGGVVSTITCRNDEPLAAFRAIAQVGGGEAFLTSDHGQIMSRLIVLVFGSRHQEKVLELFRLLRR